MNQVAVRDDRLILLGMEAPHLNLFWYTPKRNKGNEIFMNICWDLYKDSKHASHTYI